jgi:mono/diheme cytochrome c family protein
MSRLTLPAVGVALLATLAVGDDRPAAKPDPARFEQTVLPFIRRHCVGCHGPDKQKGELRLDDLSADVGKDADTWQAVLDQVQGDLMPPAKEPRPDPAVVRTVTGWVSRELRKAGRDVATADDWNGPPDLGNLVPHEDLFGKPAGPVIPPPPRAWRLSPYNYDAFARQLSNNQNGLSQPFGLAPSRSFKDYAALYTVDAAATELLLRNAEVLVERQTALLVKDGKPAIGSNVPNELRPLIDPDKGPTRQQVEAALRYQFRQATTLPPTDTELTRLVELYDKNVRAAGQMDGGRATLAAILLVPDAVFRFEIGEGNGPGRQRLAPREIARAVSFALADRPLPQVMVAADRGELATSEGVAKVVSAYLDDPRSSPERQIRFVREYFGYHTAPDVFKDQKLKRRPVGPMGPADGYDHHPGQMVADADNLVRWVLLQDKDVFRQLLTTDRMFVAAQVDWKRNTTKSFVTSPGTTKFHTLYDLPPEWKFEPDQPVKVPPTRAGLLTHPAWLVAWSGNFDNDPVRRGRWIREKLLGGLLPSVPLGVDAKVPDDPHRTLRDRLSVTRDAKCWKCHGQIDELGLPFEQYDDFGQLRDAEHVLDPEATAKNVDKKGKPLGAVTRPAPLDTTGRIDGSGERSLDGPVEGPVELARKLANSTKARQMFVRHAFRYYLGRNETVGDAKTLQDADKAFVDSGGSFRALVASLLSSDSFLFRAAEAK